MTESSALSATRVIRWVGLAFVTASLLAAIPTSSAYIAAGSGGIERWLAYYYYIGPYYYLWALLSVGIHRVTSGPLHPKNGWLRAIIGHTLLLAVLSSLLCVLVHQDNWREWLIGDRAPGYHAMSAFSYGFILLASHVIRLHRRLADQERLLHRTSRHELELKEQLVRSQLESLRGQMNPHFLFNALNCIGALIDGSQNDRAYEALEDLGMLLRTSLEHDRLESIPLRDEVHFVRRYVAMEELRFGDRLMFLCDIDAQAEEWPVPPFLLQPLIENAIKHVVAPSRTAVQVSLSAKAGDRLALTIADSGGHAASANQEGTGTGLDNLRRRMDLMFAGEASIIFNQDAGGTTIRLFVPRASKAAAGKAGPTIEKKLDAPDWSLVENQVH